MHSFSIARHHHQIRFNQVVLFFSDITGMASSSVSQEDFDNDFELTSRRSRIRTARARVVPPRTGDSSSINFQSNKHTFVLLLSCAPVNGLFTQSSPFCRECTERGRISRCVRHQFKQRASTRTRESAEQANNEETGQTSDWPVSKQNCRRLNKMSAKMSFFFHLLNASVF